MKKNKFKILIVIVVYLLLLAIIPNKFICDFSISIMVLATIMYPLSYFGYIKKENISFVRVIGNCITYCLFLINVYLAVYIIYSFKFGFYVPGFINSNSSQTYFRLEAWEQMNIERWILFRLLFLNIFIHALKYVFSKVDISFKEKNNTEKIYRHM